MDDGRLRAIVGQQLTLANRIGSENKQYMRHAIVDTIDGETTYTWGVWRETVTQTLLGNGGLCTDAEIDAAIDNGIYSGVASESGILPAYSTFTMVVVNNYAATAAASVMGVPSDWRQVTQTIITVPLSTDGQQNDGVVYMRTGIGGSTIAWGELKQVGTGGSQQGKTLNITDASYESDSCFAIDFTANFDTISFGTVNKTPYWKIGKIPQAESGVALIKKNVIINGDLLFKGPYDSGSVIFDGITFEFSAKLTFITEYSTSEGSAVTITSTLRNNNINTSRDIIRGDLTCFELYLQIDYDAKTIELILIPKY